MRAIRCLVAAILAAGIVTVVAAQPGGGGGFGGTPDVEAVVFTNAPLQEDLKVTAEQKEKIKPIATKITDLEKKQQELFSGGKFDKDAFAEIREARTKLTEERKKAYDDIFTADQKKRVKQITTQAMTFSVFNDPEAKGKGTKGGFGGPTDAQKAIMKEVQEKLKLTDSQKASIKGIQDDVGKEARTIFTDAGIEFGKGGKGAKIDQEKLAEAQKKIEKARADAWAKVEDALDDNQKKAWKELVGEKFDVSKLRPAPAPKKD